MRAHERIRGGQATGGEQDRTFDATGVGDHGAGREAGGDGEEGLLGGVDRRGHDDQIGAPDAVRRALEDFRHAERAQGLPRARRAGPARERTGQPLPRRREEDGAADEAGADYGDALELSHFQY